MEWFLFLFLFLLLIVALLAVWVSRQRRLDPHDVREAGRARAAAEAKKYDWLGGGG